MDMKNNFNIQLFPVTKEDIQFLYDLLQERPNYPNEFRTPTFELPSFSQHELFVKNFLDNNEKNPYEGWYTININSKNERIGAVVLKKDGEWGYHILQKYWDQGFGTIAIRKLFLLHPKMKFWGRCKPGNKRAIHQFEKLGFTLTSLTFEKLD